MQTDDTTEGNAAVAVVVSFRVGRQGWEQKRLYVTPTVRQRISVGSAARVTWSRVDIAQIIDGRRPRHEGHWIGQSEAHGGR